MSVKSISVDQRAPAKSGVSVVASGAPGLSAYQIAVQAGFIGTQDQWLASLHGAPGAGSTGPANTLSIGTVTTTGAGSSASATITGTAPTQTLNLSIPRGADGSTVHYRYLTAFAAAIAGDLLFCDTTASAFTVALPTTPAINDGVTFRNAGSDWSVHNLIVDPGPNNINSVTGTLVRNVADEGFSLVWVGGSVGWMLQSRLTAIELTALAKSIMALIPGLLPSSLPGSTGVMWNDSGVMAVS